MLNGAGRLGVGFGATNPVEVVVIPELIVIVPV